MTMRRGGGIRTHDRLTAFPFRPLFFEALKAFEASGFEWPVAAVVAETGGDEGLAFGADSGGVSLAVEAGAAATAFLHSPSLPSSR